MTLLFFPIATSDGTKSSLTSTQGGHCKTGSMKFIIHVCINEQGKHCYQIKGIFKPHFEIPIFSPLLWVDETWQLKQIFFGEPATLVADIFAYPCLIFFICKVWSLTNTYASVRDEEQKEV